MYREEDLSGRTIGDYSLIQRIGHGGMSSVYLARQPHPQRTVALKLLWLGTPPYDTQTILLLERFKREADIVGGLRHSAIIDIYDYGEEGPYAFLIMPYFKGGSLGDLLKRQGTLTAQQTCSFLQQIAPGLDHAHDHGVIHRDLKPENFLLSEDLSQLVIADFGIARVTSPRAERQHPTLTQDGTLFGTYEYMAPENFRDHATVDYRADIYSLGIVLFQLLSGELPFDGDLYTVVEHHKYTPLPWLSISNDDIPFAVDLVLQKATHKDPAHRHQSATELAREFEQAICLSAENGPTLNTFSHLRGSTRLLAHPSSGTTLTPVAPNYAPQPASTFQPLHDRPPSRAHRRTPSYLLLNLIVLIILLVLIGLPLGLLVASANTSTHLPGSSRPPVAPPGLSASQSLHLYFADVDANNYQQAYALTDATFQHAHSYSTFVAGYRETRQNTITFTADKQVSGTKELITINDRALENRPSGLVTNTYIISYTMILDHGTWKIDYGKLLSATHNR
jgi:serine/threonine protein kinase